MAMASERRETGAEAVGLGGLLNNPTVRGLFFQALTAVCVLGLLLWFVQNAQANLSARNMSAGFDFLNVTAGFSIGFTLIPYVENDPYLRVFYVGIVNTLLVAVISIFFATVLGLVVGLARLSSNFIIGALARGYVEALRNTPLLLQIIAWYIGVFNLLPRPRDSLKFMEVFTLNNRGFYMPRPAPEPGFEAVMATFAAAVVFAWGLGRYAARRRELTGRSFVAWPWGLGAVLLAPTLAHLALGAPLSWDLPALSGFNYGGGMSVPPSFCALVVALSVYTSCFIAEIVRSGVQAVSKGQREAAGALNLSPGWTMRLIILPQALRVIIPPLISQYLNVTKNSSLAIAVGFPDLVSVWMNTSINQSGRAIPIVAMTMAFYCAVSLTVSLVMNVYNRRVQFKER
jgi:general L-amino acid transport system permease protein